MNRFHTIILVFILCIAFVTRLIGLGSYPKGLHNDEASFLLNATALMQTGKDEDGRPFPLYLNSFIDPKPALYSYLQIPFIKFLGTSTTAARMPAALFGILSIMLVYFFVQHFLENRIALLSAGLLTISPWHIIMSRATQEVIVSFAFGVLALIALQYVIKTKKLHLLAMITFFLSITLSMYMYHATKIVLPLMVVATLLHRKKLLNIQTTIIIVLSVCIAFFITFVAAGTRFQSVGVFSNQQPQLILEEEIRTATPVLPRLAIRFFYNKLTNYSLDFAQRYLDHLSPQMLFFNGGQPERYKVPHHGLLYVIELPLIFLGIFTLLKDKKHRNSGIYLLTLLFISPIAAALTWQEVPSSVRSFFMVLPLTVFIAVGIQSLASLRKIFAVLLLVFGYGWGTLYFANQLIVQQPRLKPWHRNTADEHMAEKLASIQETFSQIVVSRNATKQPYVYLALYNLLPPQQLQQSHAIRTSSEFQLGRYFFTEVDCPLRKEESVLFVVHAPCQHGSGFISHGLAGYDDGVLVYEFLSYEKKLDADLSVSFPPGRTSE